MTKIIFDKKYTWVGVLGAWFESREVVTEGTVRLVRNRLFYAWRSTYQMSFPWKHSPRTAWCAVENNEVESMRAFKESL